MNDDPERPPELDTTREEWVFLLAILAAWGLLALAEESPTTSCLMLVGGLLVLAEGLRSKG